MHLYNKKFTRQVYADTLTPNLKIAKSKKARRPSIIRAILASAIVALCLVVVVILIHLYVLRTRRSNECHASPTQLKLRAKHLTWQTNDDKPSYENERTIILDLIAEEKEKEMKKKKNSVRESYSGFDERDLVTQTDKRQLELVQQLQDSDLEIPTYFDAREHWNNCPQIRNIYDQAACGSCWAIAAASMITDRTCIAMDYAFQGYISANQFIFCCQDCGQCAGGNMDSALKYWTDVGMVSESCMPYSFSPTCGSPCSARTFSESIRTVEQFIRNKFISESTCSKTCHDGTVVDEKDRHFGSNFYSLKPIPTEEPTESALNNEEMHVAEDDDNTQYTTNPPTPSSIPNMNEIIVDSVYPDIYNNLTKLELMQRGPIISCFPVFEDFFYYKSGIYSYTAGDYVYSHCVKVIGWGQDNETNLNYWTISNSWGKYWGENGTGRIAMIEESNQNIVSRQVDLLSFPYAGVARN